jgi:large subunit ribosomal protein L25
MQEILLELDTRDVVGKAVKHLRTEGIVPAVIHDHGKESINVSGEYGVMLKAYMAAGKHHPIHVKAGGKEYTAMIKYAEFSPKKHELRHVVFNAVKANQKVTAEIPVHIKLTEGNDSTPAERAGFVVLRQLEAVEVEATATTLPDALYFDGEKLTAVGDHATVADLVVPKGVTIKTEADHQLAAVFEPSALAAANDAAGGDADESEATADVNAGEAAEGLSAEKAAEASQAKEEQKKA